MEPPVTEEEVEETAELASEEEEQEEDTLESLRQTLAEIRVKNQAMAAKLQANKDRVEELWQVSCDRLIEFEVTLLSKDRDIAVMHQMLRERPPSSPGSVADGVPTEQTSQSKPRKGKDPWLRCLLEMIQGSTSTISP